MLWIRLGLQELFKNRGFALFFVLNMTLGLAGFIAIHSFGRSLDRHLDDNLKEILTADLVVSSHKPLSSEDIQLIDHVLGPNTSQARLISFYTMVKTSKNARLIRVMAIDDPYPLYGEFSLENGSLTKNIQSLPQVFMTRDTAYALGITQQTDQTRQLKIGTKIFTVHDYFTVDPDKSLTSVELAPKIYMGIDQLSGTGLIRTGSRIWYSRYYRFKTDEKVSLLTQKLRNIFADSYPENQRANIYDSRDVNRSLGRMTGYFTGYMGLVSVVTLFLAGIATAYLFRGYLNLKQKEIAVLKSIGAQHYDIWVYISFQLLVLGLLAAVLAIFVSLILVPAFPIIFQGLIPEQVALKTDPATILLALGLSIIGSQIFCLPVFIRLFDIKPLMLLRGSVDHNKLKWSHILRLAVGVLPGLASFIFISIYAAGSLNNGLIFVAGFAIVLFFLSLIGWALLRACKFFSNTQTAVVKIAFRNLFRNKWASLSCFVTIALGAFLISLIPQIQKGLQNEIIRPEGLKLPAFFLVDIQEEQKNAFTDFMENQEATLANLSPMVRGRILTRNDLPFQRHYQKSDKRPGRRGGQRFEFNFSHRESLDVSETIIQGNPLSELPWDEQSNLPFEVSVEQSFAERYQIQIGDLLGFEIMGIPFEGRVKNLRKIRWNSFQPNFFLLFQDGVLNDAPKTYLASVSNVSVEKRQEIKNKIVDTFPNVSVIDVTRMAGTILSITDKLSLSIRFMAWLAIAAGVISIFSIARHEARKNENQINLLKILGSTFMDIHAITLLEFGFIGFTASLFAILLSYAFSWAISWYFFDSLWQADILLSFIILLLTTCVCMMTALFAARNVLKSKPVKLLANTHT